MALSTPSHLAKASGAPEAMMVISPDAALAAPPETGPSIISRPMPARRLPRARANSGDTVALAMTTEPGARLAAAPFSPNNTVSVWSALMTSTTTASTFFANTAGESAA